MTYLLNPLCDLGLTPEMGWESAGGYGAALMLMLCLTAIAYYSYAIHAAVVFLKQEAGIDHDFHPPVSILKPICGFDEQTYANLASFCQQDYPNYQIIFGVQELHDSSMEVVKQIIRDFPEVDIQLIVNDRTLGTNRKVNNLASALARASHDVLVLADSDVRVGPDYLQQVVQPLKNPQVGVITCLYRSIPQGWVATLESLHTPTAFHPGVLVSNHLEGAKFAMGSTIVIRRSVLEEIGGFKAIANFLADDFQLGHLSAQAGYQVVLSRYIVDHILPEDTLINALQRQIRWAIGIRVSRSWGYVGLIFSYGTLASTVLLLMTDGAFLSWMLWGLAWGSRVTMAWIVGVRCLQDPVAKSWFWLSPVRDFLSFALWIYGFLGNTFHWRGQLFRLTRQGEMVPLTPRLSNRVKFSPR
ncbi:bacteriohopanetetrol glucosamine biosynthesis glycosyltransferase HpnI [Leptodesmis sichuanensis]|uniref:bacteriohopanetetrol glucosamine biosynthesis glycosyltransferase HpnI n=1 Tax=Leptodesmis sichuanensis TaxID=2906798 RepID=UPI001F24A6A3|nr:bacteriohopanetetrol glucosamine biosynthesis glycosyltransferase HpnI [Leptodesmis sichuanensis]